jgi:hypothetical protein
VAEYVRAWLRACERELAKGADESFESCTYPVYGLPPPPSALMSEHPLLTEAADLDAAITALRARQLALIEADESE